MANSDTPFGLRAVSHPSGLGKSRVTPYYVPASYATALFPGDPVIVTGTSNDAEVNVPGVGVMPAGSIAEVNKSTAATSGKITGVIVGVAADPNGLERRYMPGSTGGVVYVNDDPATEFEIQSNGVIAAADIGLNANLSFANAGSTATGQSGAELDEATKNTTAGLQLRILRIVPRADNALGDKAKLVVRINQHTAQLATAGI